MHTPAMRLQIKKDLPIVEQNEGDFFLSKIDDNKMLLLIEKYAQHKPIPFMSRVNTPKGEGFVVGYFDMFSYYKREGCLLLRDFAFPEYKVLLDRGTKDADEYGKAYRLNDFDKLEVEFIASFLDWCEQRKLDAEEYFKNMQRDREKVKQEVMNKETTKINEAANLTADPKDAEPLDKYMQESVVIKKEITVEKAKELYPDKSKLIDEVAKQEPPKPKFNLRR